MRTKAIGATLALALLITACGTDAGGPQLPEDKDTPVLRVTSEGGFAPVEFILGQGPRYTLMADGRLIHEGPVIAIYPGPLLPNYLVTQISDDQMKRVLELVDKIGLPEMDDEVDDTFASIVADANTEVVRYWDAEGVEHSYSVYALGLEPSDNPATQAFSELLVELDRVAASGEPEPFEGERVRVVAGIGFIDAEFEDVRDWALEDTNLDAWVTYPNDWKCQVYGPGVLEVFEDASQATQWVNPDPASDQTLKLVARPLHPGEPDCHNQ